VYDCSPNDRVELESIQQKILERIRDLRDAELPLREDTILENYNILNTEIQNCILNDHSFGSISLGLVFGAGIAVALIY